MSTIFDRMRQEFPNQEYRHTYANGLVDSKIATQLKVLREQRELTQAQLAEKVGMQQARISVLEDVNYSSWSISTLRRIGKAFDLWLDVEWKEFGELPKTLHNLSRDTLERDSYDNDLIFNQVEPEEVTSEDIPASLKEKVLGVDRQQFWQRQETPKDILATPICSNVIQFPYDRISRRTPEALSNEAISRIAG
jgi:transcriptional regulator with XRE-family HTH domain